MKAGALEVPMALQRTRSDLVACTGHNKARLLLQIPHFSTVSIARCFAVFHISHISHPGIAEVQPHCPFPLSPGAGH